MTNGDKKEREVITRMKMEMEIKMEWEWGLENKWGWKLGIKIKMG